MPLGEIPDDDRTCENCVHEWAESDGLCCGCARSYIGPGRDPGIGTDYWMEDGASVRERAEARIAELEAVVDAFRAARPQLVELGIYPAFSPLCQCEKCRAIRALDALPQDPSVVQKRAEQDKQAKQAKQDEDHHTTYSYE